MDSTHDSTHGTHDSTHGSTHGSTEAGSREGAGRAHRAGAFDIRVFIGALLGIYGLVLLLTSIFGTTQEELDRAGGIDVNLWTGLGLLVAAAAFVAWARLRPVVVPAGAGEDPARTDGADGDDGAGGAGGAGEGRGDAGGAGRPR